MTKVQTNMKNEMKVKLLLYFFSIYDIILLKRRKGAKNGEKETIRIL